MSEFLLYAGLWWLSGIVTMVYLFWVSWNQGELITVRELLLAFMWTFAGPCIVILIGYLKLRMLDWSTLLNKSVIKGKKK